jgi:hypothetical protein
MRYQGIRPALKYMVATTKRYQKILAHSLLLVNINPRYDEPSIVKAEPITVLARDMKAALGTPS